MKRLIVLLPLFGLAVAGCLPFGLGGDVDGEDLSFVDIAYVEVRDIDSTATEFHDIEVWLMPLEDSCERFGPMVESLTDLRAELDFGLAPDDYCDGWEAIWEEHTGLDSFWVGHIRLHALPRAEDETPQTTYTWFDETGSGNPTGPSWDGELAWYAPPTFEACATEFSGDDVYGPKVYEALDGEVELTDYEEDDSITAELRPVFDYGSREQTRGRAPAELCTAALDWPLEFGGGGDAR